MPTTRDSLLSLAPICILALLAAACGDKSGDEDDGPSASEICYDEDLGESLEFDLASASSEGDDYQLADCNGEEIGTDAEDYGWTWTAPASGGYTISSSGSSFDTVMAVHADSCTGELLACNDDLSFDNDGSEVYLELVAGDTIVIVVDGYDAYASGTIELHVLQDL